MTAPRMHASSPTDARERGRAGLWPPAQGEWLVADIGGTNARFDLWTPTAGLSPSSHRAYRNEDFRGVAAVVEAYRNDIGSKATQAMLAVAAPVGLELSVPLTNRDWRIDVGELRTAAGLSRLCLVNDLVAAACGIGTLRANEIDASPGEREPAAPSLVIGVGTGLGVAMALAEPPRTRILASEAGHMTASVNTPTALAARDLATRQHGRPSWERLLSGPGLALFDAVERGDDRPDAPEQVATRALSGESAAARAVQAFAQALGQFAGDLCLAMCAWGGVYFTGGVVHGLDSALDLGVLRTGFADKGRLSSRLRTVPLFRVRAGDLAARGLDQLLAGGVEAPIIQY
jgi:glucokinase